ncbi:ABC transporter permease [Ornithinibacillus halophilus]|uniref:Glycine betaine/proline transport system permease protein n=1 Tax=Ornithinibacillus halophilus TaxID=930117 RepID=A0A1M5L1L9_9BACI|nr:ABC transporter permease subunit [Ornithinibacillus halophilus]SHG58948.1 glycine betaine/proline transport system permease protein [Ornithinibacillus halophilus]
MFDFYIPLEDWINAGFEKISSALSPFLRSSSEILETLINAFEDLLLWPPEIVIMVLVSLLVWWASSYRLAIFAFVGLLLTFGIDIWDATMATIALALSGTAVSLIIGIPLGIIASQSNVFERILRPILDFMQTIPSFVYLIPAVMFFGMGKVAALVATMIFAMPPAVRLTTLGIREVSGEMVEAAKAFGSGRWQTLKDVQLPLALPTIMAGVNQCIMMALAMTVIASMIGAGGLGNIVLRSMQSINIGLGVVGGLGIVVLAILLDRMTESISNKMNKNK